MSEEMARMTIDNDDVDTPAERTIKELRRQIADLTARNTNLTDHFNQVNGDLRWMEQNRAKKEEALLQTMNDLRARESDLAATVELLNAQRDQDRLDHAAALTEARKLHGAEVRQAREMHAHDIEAIGEWLHARADDIDDFDAELSELNISLNMDLPVREREWEVSVTITLSGCSEEDARKEVGLQLTGIEGDWEITDVTGIS